MVHLNNKGYYCPKPICDKNNNFLQELRGKPAIIVNFLDGKSKKNITIEDCYQVGSSIGLMHFYSHDFKLERSNSLSIEGWETLIKNCYKTIPIGVLDKLQPNLMKDIQNSFDFFLKFWPHYLPKGFIHGDLFPDNVFFVNNKISGVIDFYFSCTDILTYDLAIAINAWCFDKKNNFKDKNYKSLLRGYNSKRRLSDDEKFFLPLLCQAAALRFLLTRLFDWVNTPNEANVVPKNPEEYIIKHKYFKKLVGKINYTDNLK
jgi:homoserine kinase type II